MEVIEIVVRQYVDNKEITTTMMSVTPNQAHQVVELVQALAEVGAEGVPALLKLAATL